MKATITNLADAIESDRVALTAVEVSRILQISPRLVATAITEKQIYTVKVGSRQLIPRERFLKDFGLTADANESEPTRTPVQV